MKFQFGNETVLPSIPIDLAFERLTSVSYVEQVIQLSGTASDFELLSDEGDVLHYRFLDNVSALFGVIKKSIPIIVKQTRDTNKKNLVFESNADQGTVTIVKVRSFAPTTDGGTLVTETVDGECSMMYQPMAKLQGQKALIEHMNKYHTLFDDVST
jgi:hypothetical protein